MQKLSNMPSCLRVRSSFNYFPAHQSAATNSIHLQSTYTPHLQYLSNRRHIQSPVEHLRWSFFCRKSRCLQTVGYFRRRAPSWMFGRILNATLIIARRKFEEKLSITWVIQGNLILTLPLNSLDLHQTQNQKMKSWTDPASSFHIPENVEVFSNPTLYPTSITMSSITPNRTKANHHWLNHVQILNTH